SIGVVAQIPNFNRFLKSKDIDIELHTAGQYKRTLTLLGENTEGNARSAACRSTAITSFPSLAKFRASSPNSSQTPRTAGLSGSAD
ncbi:S49 family peptidase, partial [Salmonella enterica subsp. enterica serovar Anatum]|nr:S49 family peptidase [Salmonella enterica subsp. enterica serovar Anatum]